MTDAQVAALAQLRETPDQRSLVEVEHRFREQLSPLRLFPGGALAVYYKGELVLDLVDGYSDTQTAELVQPDTLFSLFSGTKPFAAVALWQLIERGKVRLNDRVVDYWPEFGCNGKYDVLIRHILSHRGGFPTTPAGLTPLDWNDSEAVRGAIARMPIEFHPGSTSAYHFLTQHWVIGELVLRIDGRHFDTYLADEITRPLGLFDTYVGLPPELQHRVAKLHATDGSDELSLMSIRMLQTVPFHQIVIPGASGVSTARDMSRFYAALAAGGALNGTRILKSETVDLMLQTELDGEIDVTFDAPIRRCLGFELGGLQDPKRHWPGATSTDQTFWHGGMGSSVTWADRETGVAMAFLSNGARRDSAGAIARRDLSDCVRAGCRP